MDKELEPQKESIQAERPQETPTDIRNHVHRRLWPWGAMIGVLLIVFISFSVGWVSHEGVSRVRNFPIASMMRHNHRVATPTTYANPTDGTPRTRLSGVVTQVNGSTFTIAGNGTTKIITTDASTTYNIASNRVSVNDSVEVLGSDTNGTFTATSVDVLNR